MSIFKPASPVSTFILKARIACKYLAMKSALELDKEMGHGENKENEVQ